MEIFVLNKFVPKNHCLSLFHINIPEKIMEKKEFGKFFVSIKDIK
jgi:hypothetical protein